MNHSLPLTVSIATAASIHRFKRATRKTPNSTTTIHLVVTYTFTISFSTTNQCGGSAKGWADKTIGTHVHFNDQRRQLVYQMISLLYSIILEANQDE